jgi:hypothetical protein
MAEHALFSPSAGERWISCPGSLALEADQPNTSSSFADEGTAAHTLADWCLRNVTNPPAYAGRIIEVGERKFVVDEDMMRHVQRYIDAVREQALGGILLPESRVYFGSAIGQPDELAFGTSDAIVITADGELQVHDLKYGQGVRVDAVENEQMMLYALGAVAEHELLGPFERIRLFIHQPRLDAVSEWGLTAAELAAFADRARAAADHARMTLTNREAGAEGTSPAELAEAGLLSPSESACRWCRAKAVCPALERQISDALIGDFTDLTAETPDTAQGQLPQLYGDELGRRMALVDQVEAWCKAVRARVEAELLSGRKVKGFKLVEGRRGNRAWTDPDAVETTLKTMRLKLEDMYDLKLISPTTAEKLVKAEKLGPRQWAKLETFIARAEGKPSVAPVSDPRPALTRTPAEQDFAPL